MDALLPERKYMYLISGDLEETYDAVRIFHFFKLE